MNIACPHCGTHAAELGGSGHLAARQEFAFQCLSQSCGKKLTGVLTLSRGDPGNIERFSDRFGKPLAEMVGTDC